MISTRCRKLLLCGYSFFAASTTYSQVVERPVYAAGDTWTYRTTAGSTSYRPGQFFATEKRTVVGPGETESELLATYTSEDGKSRTVVWTLDFNDVLPPANGLPKREIKAWRWPVNVGDSWKYDGYAPGTTWEARVKGWEDVEVPAGKFRAIKVERELIAGAENPRLGRNQTVWYSPLAKVNVKSVTSATSGPAVIQNDSRELESYQVK